MRQLLACLEHVGVPSAVRVRPAAGGSVPEELAEWVAHFRYATVYVAGGHTGVAHFIKECFDMLAAPVWSHPIHHLISPSRLEQMSSISPLLHSGPRPSCRAPRPCGPPALTWNPTTTWRRRGRAPRPNSPPTRCCMLLFPVVFFVCAKMLVVGC